ncbi:polysaccharide export protein [Paraglaciecola aquimarina]|uniref:Polysaccharide export protein n=1 Tax=Paraglaciecola algarum TaxID=3050085 RepID=A0ABS9DAB2_9ALTE|nr:polysaccharide biosynthesis/export family protein [Paraglaciecola sp. G1-23]MCF2949880.1 polysaccharide export protein [Paraglaciecola sp. G1-23]
MNMLSPKLSQQYHINYPTCWVVLVCLLALFASSQTVAQDGTSGAENHYRLGADDEISVKVFNEPDLSLPKTRVSANGNISMPLIGQVQVKGLTIDEVELKITKLYLGDYLKKPDVSVSVVEYRQFYVNGEVDKPGGYSYREGMTIQRAISLAGGFTERAARNKIQLMRENDPNNISRVDLNSPVKPGDVITVEESFF